MSWFHHTKLERFRSERHERLALAQRIQSSTYREEFLTQQRTIDEAISAASTDRRSFEAAFGERLPSHMERLLNLESSIWLHLRALLRERYTEEQYRTLTAALHPYLNTLIDVLHALEESVTSCLSAHYNEVCNHLTAQEHDTRPPLQK